MKKTLAPLFLFLIPFLLPSPVNSQSSLSLIAIPPRLEITGNPGDIITEIIKVKNESTTAQFFNVEVKDIIVKDKAGTPVTIDSTDPNRWAAAPWIQVSPTKFKLERGELLPLSLTVIIPEDALPGGHYAVVLHCPEGQVGLDQSGSSVNANVGSLIYITIPGDIKEDARVVSLRVPPLSEYGPLALKTEIENFSDIHIKPTGSISVYNWFGKKSDDLPLEDQNIFPYTSRTYENLLDRKWLFGRYKAQLEAAYGTTGQLLLATVFFWVIPWKLILITLLALTIIILLILLLKKRQDRESLKKLDYDAPSPSPKT